MEIYNIFQVICVNHGIFHSNISVMLIMNYDLLACMHLVLSIDWII